MRTPKSFLIAAAAPAVLLAALACAVNPVTGQKQPALISEAKELQIGEEGDKQVAAQFVRLPDEPLQAYVNGVGQKVAAVSHRPNLAYHYTVLDAPMINAFALPGGHIYVTRGILEMMNSEEELAGTGVLLTQDVLIDGPRLLLAALTLAILLRWQKIPEPLLVLAGALIGLLLHSSR